MVKLLRAMPCHHQRPLASQPRIQLLHQHRPLPGDLDWACTVRVSAAVTLAVCAACCVSFGASGHGSLKVFAHADGTAAGADVVTCLVRVEGFPSVKALSHSNR